MLKAAHYLPVRRRLGWHRSAGREGRFQRTDPGTADLRKAYVAGLTIGDD